MTERYKSDADLNALSGTTDARTGMVYPTIGADPWYTAMFKALDQANSAAGLASCLQVYKDGDLTFGVRGGFLLDGNTVRTIAAASGQALTNNATNTIYLTAAGVLTVNTTGFPSAVHMPLATIATGTASAAGVAGLYNVVDVVDLRGKVLFRPVRNSIGVRSLTSQVLNRADFTDNLDEYGHIDFTSGSLPAGAIVLGWSVTVTTGFTGNVSAIMSIGSATDYQVVSGDVETSVFAAATVGGVPMFTGAYVPNPFCSSAVTPRVTVYGNSDFTAIVAGAMTLTIYYLDTLG